MGEWESGKREVASKERKRKMPNADTTGPEQAGETPLTRRRFLMMIGGAGTLAGLGVLEGRCGAGALAAAGTGALQAAKRTSRALGADVSLLALHPSREIAERAVAAAFVELEQVDAVMSLYRPESQLCRLNREGVLALPHPWLVAVLRRSVAMAERSGGAFDVTVQPLWDLYSATQKEKRIPDTDEVAAVLPRVGWRRLEVSDAGVRLQGDGMAVTLNGIAQGYAADRVLAALRAHGIRHALVNTGEIGTLGRKEDGKPWAVGIQHPRQAGAYIAVADLQGRCLSTSGDYATAFSPDRAHNHLLDPATGRSPAHFASVTILAPTATVADALSTAVFVLGYEQGMRRVLGTPGVEALFVMKNGDVRATRGFPHRT